MIDLDGYNFKTHNFKIVKPHSPTTEAKCIICGKIIVSFRALKNKNWYEWEDIKKQDINPNYIDISISCNEYIIKNIIT